MERRGGIELGKPFSRVPRGGFSTSGRWRVSVRIGALTRGVV